MRGSADHFDRIEWRRARILPGEHFGGASKDLKGAHQIKHLGPGRADKYDSTRLARNGTAIVLISGH